MEFVYILFACLFFLFFSFATCKLNLYANIGETYG